MEKLKPNQVRHNLNLLIFSGFWRGKYFLKGIVHKKEKLSMKKITNSGKK